jgi:hypothetical protein
MNLILTKTESRNFSNLEEQTLSNEKEKHDECKMTQTDSEGNINLCCCYILGGVTDEPESQPLSNNSNPVGTHAICAELIGRFF